MRAVIQRVSWARVRVDEETIAEIGPGLTVLLGVEHGDTDKDVEAMATKVVHLRIFEDDHQNMNRSLLDVDGALLVVSQFTLLGDCRKGRRPSFTSAMEPEGAEQLCDHFAARCRDFGPAVQTGRFRSMMEVELCNSGPVTMLLDTHKTF